MSSRADRHQPRCSEVGHQAAPIIARLVASHERQLRLASENDALSEHLVGLEHELRRLQGIPTSNGRAPEPATAPELAAAAEHSEGRPRHVTAPPAAPHGATPGHLLASLPAPEAAPLVGEALVGTVLPPMMAEPVAPPWPGEPRDQREEGALLWVLVTPPVSGGRRLGPAFSRPKELIGEPRHTIAESDVHVLVALILIIVTTAWLIALAWWVLR